MWRRRVSNLQNPAFESATTLTAPLDVQSIVRKSKYIYIQLADYVPHMTDDTQKCPLP